MSVDRIPAIKVLLLPKDTNALGTIFGGVILSHVDLASAVEARKTAPHRYVTAAMREVEFHATVFVGDIVNFYTETRRVGRTSITVGVEGSGALEHRTQGRARQSDRSGGGAGRHRRERPPDCRNERVTRPESWPSARAQGTRHPNLLFPFPALPFIL